MTGNQASGEPSGSFRSEAQKNADAIKVLRRLVNIRGATEACERAIQALQKEHEDGASARGGRDLIVPTNQLDKLETE